MTEIGEDGVVKCSGCSCRCAEIRGGCLVITQRHHGERHTTVIPIAEIVQWCGERLLLPAEILDRSGVLV